MKINLPDYIKIASSIKRNKVSVREEEMESVLFWLQQSRAKFTLKSVPCQKGDWVEIEYYSPQVESFLKISGNKDEKGKEKKDAFVLGEGHLIPGFEKELEGMKEGQEKEFSLVFPENHIQKNLAGKKVDFQVKMRSVQNMELPEINDQFAQDLGHFENTEALKKSVKEGIGLEKENEESLRIRQEILDRIAQDSEVETPEFLVSREQNLMLKMFKEDIPRKLGISFQDYLSGIKRSEKELFESLLPQAKERTKRMLILREISRRENIDVSEGETKEGLNKTIKYLGPNEAKKLDPEKLKEYTKEVIKNEKTLAKLESFVG